MPRTIRYYLTLLLLVCLPNVHAGSNAPHVLLINSYHPQYQWTYELSNGVADTFKQVIPAENLHIEFLDGRRMVDDPVYFSSLHNLFNIKYQEFKPDIIITSDDYAFNFMLHEGDALFPNVPVVFFGVNIFEPSKLYGRKNYTGLLEGMEIEGNIELISQVQPNVNHIIMLSDQTSFGKLMATQARTVIKNFSQQQKFGHIKLEVWDNFSLDELYNQARLVDENTAFLMLAIHKDRLGHYFSFSEQLPLLAQHSPAPIYGMWGALLIGHGVLGGMMNAPYDQGVAAAKVAQRILRGTSVENIPIQPKAQFTPQFDYNLLQHFNIALNQLPENSTIHFKPDSFFDRHRSLVINAIGILTFLVVVIFSLTLNIRRRKIAERKLLELNIDLETLVEKRTEALAQKAEELERLNTTMERLAYTDLLTELPNRRAGQELLQSLFDRAQRSGEPFSIGMVDVDHFKNLNDKYGHEQGDEVLRLCAQRARSTLRAQDRLCRWGGEEFLLLMPGVSVESALLAGERLRKAVSETPMPPYGFVTISVGVTTANLGESLHSFLDRADAALYDAKDEGRNCVRSLQAAA